RGVDLDQRRGVTRKAGLGQDGEDVSALTRAQQRGAAMTQRSVTLRIPAVPVIFSLLCGVQVQNERAEWALLGVSMQ
ncbi:MAG: hypothetical protein M3Q82_10585, partial [Actinomycetota bacterium]|nr:hypothetical protein [Actinomycetota bacterium]